MNIDNIRTKEAIGACISNCKMNEIDIACILETNNENNERNDRHAYKDYTIFYIASCTDINNRNNNTHCANKWRGGVEIIIIKNERVGNTKKIYRLNIRIVENEFLKHGVNLTTYLLHVLMRHTWDMAKQS